MSKSLNRVKTALAAAGINVTVHEMPAASRTAARAAAGAGALYLFMTALGNKVDPARAAACAGEPLHRADADAVCRITGFAIGGVSPFGHQTPPPIWLDPRLMDFAQVWAAAGTPHHIFPVAPTDHLALIGATIAAFTA